MEIGTNPLPIPHDKRRCGRESVATFPVRANEAWEGTAVLTPDATTPCRAAAKTRIAEYDRPRAASPVDRGGLTGCPTSTDGTQTPGMKPCEGGVGGEGGIGG